MKKLIHQPDLGMFIFRAFIGLTMAFAHGLGKVPPPEGLVAGVTAMGFPAPLFFAWSASLAELIGGILIALGLFTRPAALFLGFTMLVAALGAHGADPFQKQELSLLYLAACVLFIFSGAGSLSLDRLIRKK